LPLLLAVYFIRMQWAYQLAHGTISKICL
jgi:hypothetical protein